MRISPLVDGHNDLPYLLRLELKNRIYEGRLDFAEGEFAFFPSLSREKCGE